MNSMELQKNYSPYCPSPRNPSCILHLPKLSMPYGHEKSNAGHKVLDVKALIGIDLPACVSSPRE